MIGAVSMYIIILIQFKFPVNLDKMDPIVDLIHFSDGNNLAAFKLHNKI